MLTEPSHPSARDARRDVTRLLRGRAGGTPRRPRRLAGHTGRRVRPDAGGLGPDDPGGGTLIFFGNGGSAADAQHLATELTVRYQSNRRAIAAIALTTDTSALTAAANDFGYETVFARQLEAIGRPGDLALGISTSGRSPNVVRALEVARERGLTAAALTGGDGGVLAGLADPLIVVPSHRTARIQEMHITLGQMLCGALEKELGLA